MDNKLVLITNDDGIESPGLLATAEAVADLGELVIVAPSYQQTAMSRSLSGSRDEFFKSMEYRVNGSVFTAYHISASPAMAVQHAYNVMFRDRKPDIIISGINYGENLGWDSMLSGTIGAAFQAAAQGTSALAVSLQTDIENHFYYGKVNWSGAKHFLRLYAERILREGMPDGVQVLKIDVPSIADEKTEWRYTNLADSHYFTAEIENPTLQSKLGDAKVKLKPIDNSLDKNSDIYAIAVDKVVSVTPLRMNLGINLR